MKNYDETVNAVFERIRAYNVKKKRRAVLTRRIAVSCCAVSLLGGGVWYLGTPRHDIPVTAVLNEDEVTTTTTTETEDTPTTTATTTTDATENTTVTTIVPTQPDGTTTSYSTTTTGKPRPSKTTTTNKTDAPTATTTVTTTQTTTKPFASTTQSTATPTTPTTAPQKIVITADEPDSNVLAELPLKDPVYIAPSLAEKMKLYEGVDVVYAVIVEVGWAKGDAELTDRFLNENTELLLLNEKKTIAYEAYMSAYEQYGWTEDVWEKRLIFKELASQHGQLRDKLRNEHMLQQLDQYVKELSDWSNNELIPLSTDERFYPFRSPDPNYAFFMELTADEINELAELKQHLIRLVYPGGDVEVVMPDMPE